MSSTNAPAPTPAPEKLLVTADEAADMLSMGKSTFWKAVRAGKVPAAVKIAGLTRWRVADLRRHTKAPPVERRPPSVPLAEGATHLYRHFDVDGKLLYVGISLSAIARLGEHKQSSHWFWRIARIEVTAYATRASAAKAERLTIQREQPSHNVVHAKATP